LKLFRSKPVVVAGCFVPWSLGGPGSRHHSALALSTMEQFLRYREFSNLTNAKGMVEIGEMFHHPLSYCVVILVQLTVIVVEINRVKNPFIVFKYSLEI
jgi:hypothetical protein